ncbi:FxLYD domain-containing protein [Methanobacterium sp.]|uniref:FxLYD domain-containing protein n=1 Tax=Methanobacterium sp. TaxID=2164 RepID=UPI003159341A
MKPFLSIILALITTILLFICEISLSVALNIYLGSLTVLLFILGGGIATWFAAGKKIRYSIYYGLILAVITLVLGDYRVLIFAPIFAGIGGFLGKMADKDSRQTFNGYHPVIAIIVGIIVMYIYNVFLGSVTGAYDLSSSGLIGFVIGAITLAVGGFTTTFLSKEKKIQYGIYGGLIVVIISLLAKLYTEMTRTVNMPENYLILIGTIAGYLLAAVLGSFAAKKAEEIENKNLKMIPITGVISIVLVMALVYGFTSAGVLASESSEGVVMGYGSGGVMSDFSTGIGPDNAPTIMDLRNGSYEVSGLLSNNANKSYSNVKIFVVGYDINGTEIAENKGVIAEIKANSNSRYDVILTPVNGKAVDSAYVTVFNSTVA